jgi:Tol biopolymer transport system component
MNLTRMLAVATLALAWVNGHPAEPAPTGFELALVDLQGQKKILGRLPVSVFAPRVSPDGRRVAFELADAPTGPNQPGVQRLYVAELDNLEKRRVLQPAVISPRSLAAVWSDDGDRIAYLATGNGGDALFWQRADGSIQPLFLVDGRAPEGWYKGGLLTFITRTGDGDYGISQLDLNSMKVSRLVDQPGSEQHSSRISPDGRWIAYASNETGRMEVWLEPLPQTGLRVQVTRAGGSHPLWSPDGSTLYFDQDGKMFRLPLTLTGASPQVGAPVELPISGFQQGALRRQFDLMPDGSAFVMLFPSGA